MRPMPSNSLADHCRGIAQRFLLTAVVVDDELSVGSGPSNPRDLTVPDPRGVTAAAIPSEPDTNPLRPLNVDPITWSFARKGMVCGVVSPQEGESDYETLAKATARSDIVILDWQLSRETGANALPLLQRILREDQPNRPRLIAFYTSQPDHGEIRKEILDGLTDLDRPELEVSTGDDHRSPINFGACRIVVYAKPGSPTPGSAAVVREEDLAERLITDFAEMVEGLLPSLVLTALTAVRENVFRVLERFGPDLDPAFLAHRASLPQPLESEQHIVEQIASELQGIMDDAVSRSNPAGLEAIKHWLRDRFDNNCIEFCLGKEISHDDALAMLEYGVEKKHGPLKKAGKDYLILSSGFSRDSEDNRELDRRLASAMSFRQVLAGTERQLSMGTVVRRAGDDKEILLCVTPRCDSVRLIGESSFLFLPLTDPKSKTPQVVVRVSDNEHRRMTISMNPSDWRIMNFAPDTTRQCVLAHLSGSDQAFRYKDVSGEEYRWMGELKVEFAQSIAQMIAERMSRVPLNKSEWLRRSERIGKRTD